MQLEIVCVRDIKADVFGQPMFVPNLGSAIRSFGDGCKDAQAAAKGDVLAKHPEDFELWHIGVYNDQNGVIAPFGLDSDMRRQIAVGSNYKD